VTQGVRAGRRPANGGRHVRTEPYRGRHRKDRGPIGPGAAAGVAVTIACAALLVCLPQPSWAGRATATAAAAHVTTAAHVTASSQATGRAVPGLLRLIRAFRLR
jgi:hypothetical protein